ncbi:AAA family ATPase [Pseudochelatococcus sp.]|uniref:AAA family ATPase n=1 Tax=Pseudochelatococcus sp. TaxID=2020869 RepID=UPI003D8FA53B
MKLKAVFVAGGMPNVTYVDRNHLSLEKKFRTELAEGYKIVAITGPTKSGKTVLCRKVIPAADCIWVDGGQVENPDDFWTSIVRSLRIPTEESENITGSATFSWQAIIGIKSQITAGSTVKYPAPTKKEILTAMRSSELTLVVDDFHYLSPAIQQEVVRSLKSEIFDGLTVVFIAVPHRAFDTISAEPEMEGRYAHITIPPWSIDDLLSIPAKGFPKLGMTVPDQICRKMGVEALQSPLLMQRFCGRVCTHYEIIETIKPARNFDPTDAILEDIYKDVAKQFGFPTFEKLAKGPQSRSKRNPRRLKDGSGSLDIYQAILMAVGKTGPKSKLHYDEIRDNLKDLLQEVDIPQKHEVSNALGHMESIAKEKIKGEPVIEWSSDYLYITDPFLRFFMKWSNIKDFSFAE